MKEFVLVEFLVSAEDHPQLLEKFKTLGEDFELIKTDYEWDGDTDGYVNRWYRMSGRINSAYATIIKLQDPFLAGCMRISYIPEDLKNKYRT